jgi:hypothetical protein
MTRLNLEPIDRQSFDVLLEVGKIFDHLRTPKDVDEGVSLLLGQGDRDGDRVWIVGRADE